MSLSKYLVALSQTLTVVLACPLLTLLTSSTSISAQIAVQGESIYTMAGPPLKNGVVLINAGKITQIGPASQIEIPAGYEILKAKIVTPGLIDAHATAGLTGINNQSHDQDHLDRGNPIQPQLRALDAFNIHEDLIGYLRGFGITTIHTGHSSGELVSGQTMIIKTVGDTVDQAVVRETAAVVATMGSSAMRREGSPGTRGKQMAMLRQELIKAQEYTRKLEIAKQSDQAMTDEEEKSSAIDQGGSTSDTSLPERDLRLEALAGVLAGKTPLLITVNRAQDIATAIRLADEFAIKIWLDGAAESYLLKEQIKASGFPVILHPAMIRAYGEYENLSFETASQLVEAGIPVAMQSGYESYVPKVRVVLFEAAIIAANGLSFEQALATVTRDAAAILGIGHQVGTLEIGKDADLALFDGDPFEYTSHCLSVIINGQVVSRDVK